MSLKIDAGRYVGRWDFDWKAVLRKFAIPLTRRYRQIHERLHGKRPRWKRVFELFRSGLRSDEPMTRLGAKVNIRPILRSDVIAELAIREEELLARWSLERDHFLHTRFKAKGRGYVKNPNLTDLDLTE